MNTPRKFEQLHLQANPSDWPTAATAVTELITVHGNLHAEAEAQASRTSPSWQQVGETLKRARVRLGISKREAAKRANLSDGAWRHLEAGLKIVSGAVVHPNPRNENLVSAALAVKVPPAVLFELAARPLPSELVEAPSPDRLLESIQRLRAIDRDLVASLINRLAQQVGR